MSTPVPGPLLTLLQQRAKAVREQIAGLDDLDGLGVAARDLASAVEDLIQPYGSETSREGSR